jgi:monoamine oxidase
MSSPDASAIGLVTRRRLPQGAGAFVWSSGDPYILGAYSYLAVGQYTAFNGIQGQREGRLHFAGEQTWLNFQGYIEGGVRSGYRCAPEIAGSV